MAVLAGPLPINFYGAQCGTCAAPLQQPDGSYSITCPGPSGAGTSNAVVAQPASSSIAINGTAVTCGSNMAPPPGTACGPAPANGPVWLNAGANVNGQLTNATCSIPPAQVVQARLDNGETPFQILSSNPALLPNLIGATWAGGIIIDIDLVNRRGLMAAPEDVSGQLFGTSLTRGFWNNMSSGRGFVVTGAGGPGLYDGKDNTTKIIAAQGVPQQRINYGGFNYVAYAAQLANNASYLGFSDWYLPSVGEVQTMLKVAVGPNSAACTAPGNTNYWSSTESQQIAAFYVDCTSGASFGTGPNSIKNNVHRVRLVRQFGADTMGVLTQGATINGSNVILKGQVMPGTTTVTTAGFCYNTVKLGAGTDYCQPQTPATGLLQWTLPLASLQAGTSYQFRTYAVTQDGSTQYGATQSWTTPGTAPAVRSVQEMLNDTSSPFSIYTGNPSLKPQLLGAQYQGGIIVDLDMPNARGLMAAPQDQSSRVAWVNRAAGGYRATGATQEGLYAGAANTQLIMQVLGAPVQGGSYAAWQAQLANDAKYLGFSDWFLPDLAETRAMLTYAVPAGSPGCSGGYFDFWTSTEVDFNHAYRVSCLGLTVDGTSQNSIENNSYRVRLLRQFDNRIPVLVTALPVLGSGVVNVGLTVSSNGGAEVAETGICYSATLFPVTGAQGTSCVPAPQTAAIPTRLMTPDTPFYFRAYARTRGGSVYYGNTQRFVTPGPSFCGLDKIGTLTGAGPHMQAVDATANRLYFSSRNAINIIDGNTNGIGSVVKTIELPNPANGAVLAVDATRGILYYSLANDKTLYAVDGLTGAPRGSVTLDYLTWPSLQRLIATNSVTGDVFVADGGLKRLYQVGWVSGRGGSRLTVKNSWSLRDWMIVFAAVNEMVVDDRSNKVYLTQVSTTTDRQFSVLDVATGTLKVLANNVTGSGANPPNIVPVPSGMLFDSPADLLFLRIGGAGPVVLSNDDTKLLGSARVPLGDGMLYNAGNAQLYMPYAGTTTLWTVPVTPATGALGTPSAVNNVGQGVRILAADAARNLVYVLSRQDQQVVVVDGSNNQARPPLPLPAAHNMLRNPKTGYVYVSHSTDNNIDVLTCR